MSARITDAAIDPSALLAEIEGAGFGAAVLFLGTVRDQNEGRSVSGMRYEAYVPMAERVLAEIVEETARRMNPCRIAAVHRVGELGIGEVSVAIAAAAPHRGDAFDLCRAVIEQIKLRLPVWKHEHYVDGDSGWVPGVAPPVGAERV